MKEIWVDFERCIGCLSCTMACAVEHSNSKEIFRAIYEEPLPAVRMRVEDSEGGQSPAQCRHCEDSPCVYACMAGALSRDEATGLVLHKKDNCVACWMCVMVCPFGAILPAYTRKTVLKCDRCPERDVPACVDACPTRALKFVDYSVMAGIIRKSTTGKFTFPREGDAV